MAGVKHQIDFAPNGRGKALYRSDPEHPNGRVVDTTEPGARNCTVELPYPAPECGVWKVECLMCGFTISIVATGLRDDPRVLRVPCKRAK